MAQPSLVLTNTRKSNQAAPPDGVGGGAAAVVETELYAADQKIYPRAVSGWFAAWRWALVWATQLAFYGGAWLTWNGRQAILFDIVDRKFFIFGLVFWPQDIIYLAVLLIIAALSLFLFTAVAGRLWCGYACPQTVYTEIFMWLERVIEGDRLRRMKLDPGGPWGRPGRKCRSPRNARGPVPRRRPGPPGRRGPRPAPGLRRG